MSANVINSIIECVEENKKPIGLIPSRRQIDWNCGYVNNWKTKSFSEYVKSKTELIILERDHGGAEQGTISDPGYDSFYHDCKNFHIIHIDPFKQAKTFFNAMAQTAEYIKFCHSMNDNIKFEIGTEEAIFRYEANELDSLLNFLKTSIPREAFNNIEYAVVQSGTAIKNGKNIGKYDSNRLDDMITICRRHNIKSKEHNGDYLSELNIKEKFKRGLDAINIAPEFGQLETSIILDEIKSKKRNDLLDELFNICYHSGKWEKWLSNSIDPTKNKEQLIKVSGHYIFSDEYFKVIKQQLYGIDNKIKIALKIKINSLLELQ